MTSNVERYSIIKSLNEENWRLEELNVWMRLDLSGYTGLNKLGDVSFDE